MSSISLQIHGSLRRSSLKGEIINIGVILRRHLHIITNNMKKNRLLKT